MASSFESVLYVMPHGPGAEFLFALLRMFFISLGVNGVVLKDVKLGASGEVGRCGNQWSCEKEFRKNNAPFFGPLFLEYCPFLK